MLEYIGFLVLVALVATFSYKLGKAKASALFLAEKVRQEAVNEKEFTKMRVDILRLTDDELNGRLRENAGNNGRTDTK